MNPEPLGSSSEHPLPTGTRPGPPGAPPEPLDVRDVMVVLVVAWAVRLAFMLVVPAGARSIDAFSWETTAGILAAGGNPYQSTSLLNWPPLWMQIIFCLGKAATALGVPFFRALQVFLILVESVVMVFVMRLIHEVAPAANARKIVMIGLALNPVAVLLVCQHCNFDVLVALWLVLFVSSLLRYHRSHQSAEWLLACLFLGLGILTKTVPLVLIPFLAGGFRRATADVKFLGAALLLGPVILGMSIIYVLAPADITSKVLLYRSQTGYFGLSGLFFLAGAEHYLGIRNLAFYVFLCAIMAGSGLMFWRRGGIGDRETVLGAALILAAIPSLGPGYASQYIYWFMPLLVATYACPVRGWKLVLGGFALVAGATYLVEYALLPEYGYNLFYLWPASWSPGKLGDLLLDAYCRMDSELGRTFERLPLFSAYLVVLAVGGHRLARHIRNQHSSIRVFAAAITSLVIAGLVGTLALIAFLFTGQPNRLPGAAGQSRADSGLPKDRDTPENWKTAVLNNLAWKLATSSDANIRDGALAVKAAERACTETHYQKPVFAGTLAAAYAEAGQFDDAVATARKATNLAATLGDTNLVTVNQSLMTWYQSGKPYRVPDPGAE